MIINMISEFFLTLCIHLCVIVIINELLMSILIGLSHKLNSPLSLTVDPKLLIVKDAPIGPLCAQSSHEQLWSLINSLIDQVIKT